MNEAIVEPKSLAGLLAQRCSEDSLGPAFADWMKTSPFTDPEAPKTPFEMDSYVIDSYTQAQALREKAAESAEKARSNNQQSDNYVLLTVLFATVLFLAGLSSKLSSVFSQQAVFYLGLVISIFTVVILVRQPIEFGETGIFNL